MKIDFNSIKTFPISKRNNKVSIKEFSDPTIFKKGNENLSCLFPKILKGIEIIEVAKSVVSARKKNKPVIIGMGAHVIKCGLSLLLIDLMKKGIITGIAMNGAGAIHDYEIAMIGETSEDVKEEIKNGYFGMVEETGSFMNQAFKKHVNKTTGLGEALSKDIKERDFPYKEYSIMMNGYDLDIPVTIHSAIGTEIIHMHPSADGSIIGKGTFNDFKRFTAQVADIGDGGCYLNIGSAVILPEVFLKAISIIRNLGNDAKKFTTVNMDMLQHYRPLENVVNRPIQGDGKGYKITGHHEIMVPLLYSLILNEL